MNYTHFAFVAYSAVTANTKMVYYIYLVMTYLPKYRLKVFDVLVVFQ